MSIFPALLGAGASLLGSVFGNNAAEDERNERQIWNNRSWDFAKEQYYTGKWYADRQRADQLRLIEQARQDNLNFIQSRVRDAKMAGIHPLYALGAPASGGMSMSGGGLSPVGLDLDMSPIGGGGMGEGLARAGQVAAEHLSRRVPKALTNAQLRGAQSEADVNEAQALYYRSMAAKALADAQATQAGTSPLPPGGEIVRTPMEPHALVKSRIDPNIDTPATAKLRLPSGKRIRGANPEAFEEFWHALVASPSLTREGARILWQRIKGKLGLPTYGADTRKHGGYYRKER